MKYRNDFFGEKKLQVSGLLTGQDITAQLREKNWESICFCPVIF